MIAQLNRGPEHRRNAPQLSDLRESGSLEQDADVVILLHRDTDKDGKFTDDVWAIVAKNRYGPLETVKLNFQGWFGRIGSNVRPWTPHRVIDD
jgi:replicative DNA helicase